MEHERHKCSAWGTDDCPDCKRTSNGGRCEKMLRYGKMLELRRNGPESGAFSGLNLGMEDALCSCTVRPASSAPTLPHSFGGLLFLRET